MYEIEFTERAKKEFLKLDRPTQERIAATLERIKARPAMHVKKLVNDDRSRLRVGDHRLLLEIDDKRMIIFIEKVGHGKNIYDY